MTEWFIIPPRIPINLPGRYFKYFKIKLGNMKKSLVFLVSPFFILSAFHSIAQSKTGADYFVGKWNIFIPGTPIGDLKRVYVFEKTADGLYGLVQDPATGDTIAKFSKVEVKAESVSVYYTVNDIEVSVVLAKKDEDHLTGKVLDNYNATGERVKNN